MWTLYGPALLCCVIQNRFYLWKQEASYGWPQESIRNSTVVCVIIFVDFFFKTTTGEKSMAASNTKFSSFLWSLFFWFLDTPLQANRWLRSSLLSQEVKCTINGHLDLQEGEGWAYPHERAHSPSPSTSLAALMRFRPPNLSTGLSIGVRDRKCCLVTSEAGRVPFRAFTAMLPQEPPFLILFF